jgi:hypothetical protein
MKDKAAKHYIRKWGSWIKNNEYQHPILSPKYDIGFIIKNCNQQLLEALEPWCSTLYIDCSYSDYIKKEQPNTKFDLKERIKPYHNEKQNNILVEFDGFRFGNNQFSLIQQLPDIIKDNGEIGSFELDIFTIEIKEMNEYQNTLIKL